MKKSLLLVTSLLIVQLSISQNALDFDGTNDVVQTTYSGVTGGADRTFEAWIKRSASSSNMCILDYGANVIYSRNTFNVGGSGNLSFISGGANFSSGTTTIPVGVWTHVAFVLNSGTGYLYINGVQVGTASISNVNTPTTGTNLRIGNRVTGGSIPFKGTIDEVRVWNVARTQTQIASTMNNEFCSAPTGLKAYYKLNHGTAGGTNTTVTSATDDAGVNNGTLTGFALTGTSSNWVLGKNISPATIASTFPVTACGSYTMPNGTVVTSAGTYFDTVGSSATCDTLASYVVTFTPAIIKSTVTDSGCVTYTTPFGTVITASGTYYDTLPTTTSCDTTIEYIIKISGAVDDSVYRVGNRITSWDTWATHQWIRCDSSNWAIPGETNNFIMVSTPGNYAVIVTRGSCVDTSECVNFNPASLSENTLINYFEVYPNPANSVIKINNIENKTISGISILDISGKMVYNKVNIESNVVNIEQLDAGVYFIRIKTNEATFNIKFVKN